MCIRDSFKGTYSKTLQVQSRVKMLEKLELLEVDCLLYTSHQSDECGALRVGACIGGATVLVQSADIADADCPFVPPVSLIHICEGGNFNRKAEVSSSSTSSSSSFSSILTRLCTCNVFEYVPLKRSMN